MKKVKFILIGVGFIVSISSAAPGQELSLQERIKIGTSAIRIGCGLESRAIQVQGSSDGAITLSKLPEKDSGSQIRYTSRETVGLIAAFQKEMTDAGRRLSEKQLACMQMYVDRIVSAVFPTSSEGERRDIRQACLVTCDDVSDACKTEASEGLSQCLEKRRQRCMGSCMNDYNFPQYQCIARFCNPDEGTNKYDWRQVCKVEAAPMSCSSERAACREKCL